MTAAEVICDALASHHARPGDYDVRFGKLGTKVLLRVSERASTEERQLFIAGPEEVPQAAERIATALVENKTIAETQGFGDGDTSAFVGAGPAIAYFKANEHDVLSGYTGMGFEGAVEAGASFLRSSHAGALVALRVDVPAFRLDNTSYSFSGPPVTTYSSMYLAAVSITFGLTFGRCARPARILEACWAADPTCVSTYRGP